MGPVSRQQSDVFAECPVQRYEVDAGEGLPELRVADDREGAAEPCEAPQGHGGPELDEVQHGERLADLAGVIENY